MPEDFLHSFLIFTLCVSSTVSCVILRSRWHGWMLAGVIFVRMYGISTVARSQHRCGMTLLRLSNIH
jgi:hypothetical protein